MPGYSGITVALDPCNGSEERFASLTVSLDNDGDGLYDLNDPDCQSVPAGSMSVSPAGGLSASGTQGGPFNPLSQSYTLTNTGNAPINWTASKTQPWVTLSQASGTLAASATATVTASINSGANSLAAGSYNDTVTFTNTTNGTGNASRSVSLTVNAVAAPTITTASPLPAGTAGTAYSQTLAASGGTTPYSWSVASGTLPAGLGLSAAGVLSGTPTTAGTSSFTVQVTGGGSSTKGFSLTINSVAAPTITTASPLTAGTVGTAYSQTLAASGGTTPYGWSVSAGVLPAGLSLNSSTGVLSGIPTTAGTSSFTVQVTGGGSSTKDFSLTISAAPDTTPPVLNSVDPSNTQDVPVNTVLTVTFSEEVVVPAGSFTLSDGAGSVPGTVSVNGATATFAPSVILTDNTTYTVTLTTAVTDLAGNPLETGYSSTFTTSAASPAPPLELESSGGGGCAIARTGGGVGEVAGAYGFLALTALGIAIRRRVKRTVK